MTTATTDNLVQLDEIEVRNNYRRMMDPARLSELAHNIKKVGVLEPVLVRRDGKSLVLIAGARRLAASKEAGLKTIPARILEVDEKQAAEIQALENLHREDLSPLDEARAFKTLLELGSHTHSSLAERIDKSLTYIYRGLKLLELPEKAMTALEKGIISTGHAHQLLRAGPNHMEALVKYATTKIGWTGKFPSVDDLRREIEKTVQKDLKKAIFPKNCAFAGEMPCTTCPFNSENQGALFDGATKGYCVNPTCFSKKTAAAYRELQEKGAKKYPGLKFQGAGVKSGYGGPEIKGAWVVEKEDAKITKAVAASPEKFRYGILKPPAYSSEKPQLVLVCTEAKLAGREEARASGYRQMTPEEQAKAAFIQEHFEARVQSAALSRLKIQQEDLLVIGELMWGHGAGFLGSAMVELEALKEVTRDMDFPRKAFASLGQPQMTQLIVLSLLERAYVRLEDVLVERGVNMEALAKKAKEEAQNLWRVQEETKSAAAKNGSPKGGKEVDAVPAGQKS